LSGYGITDAYSSSNPSGYISGITFGNVTTALGYTPENAANKGNANGYASLDGSGLVPASQLPSYVDDVLEYANLASFPGTGTTGKIYVALDTNKTYRWSGSAYIYINSGAVDSVAGKTGVVTLNNSDVGLGSVENKSSATIRGEITSSNVTTALGFTPYNATNPSGYISGITSSNVTTALGYTPYNATNPSGYITSSALSPYLPLAGGNLTGRISWGTSLPNAKKIIGIYETGNLWTGIGMASTTASPIIAGDGNVSTLLDIGYYSLDGAYNWTSSAQINKTSITFGGNTVLHAGNYNSYSLPLTGGTVSGLVRINNQLRVGQNTNGTAYIDAYDGYAWFGRDSNSTGIRIDASGNVNITGALTQGGNQVLHAGNYTSYSPSLTGSGASGTWGINISGSAVLLTSTQGNWNSTGVINNVVGMLGWKNYSNSHVIFDASASTTPSGGACNNTNPQNNWTGTYPTLMGWNGSNTYGVRVDSARVADSAGSAGSVDFANLTNKGSGTGTYTTSGDYRAPIFYDSPDTSFYVNPSDISRFSKLAIGSVDYSSGMQVGSLALGNVGTNYHYTSGWSGSMNGGILANCADNWEFVVHDSAHRLASPFVFWGGGSNYIEMGRDLGWGTTPIFATASFRAPIFYDSNDTAFYVDPNSNSYLNTLNAAFTNFRAHIDVYGPIYSYKNDSGYILQSFNQSAGNPAQFNIRHSLGDTIIENARGVIYENSTFSQANNSYRAPIFYDSNNTAFYVDPASGSNIGSWTSNSVTNIQTGSAAAVWQQITNTDASGTYAYLQLSASGAGNGYLIKNRTTGNSVSNQSLYLWNDPGPIEFVPAGTASLRTTISTGGSMTVATDVRTPIFYDSGNTSGYADLGNGTVRAYAASGGQGGFTVADTGGFLTYRITTNNSGNGWSWRFTTNEAVATSFETFFSVGYDSGIAQVSGTNPSFRAPIFYDSNDTNYYLDPSSSGVSLRIGGAIQSNHTAWTGEMNKIQWHGSSLYFQNMNDGIFIFRNSNGAEPYTLYANGNGTASGSWRSPIFYDSNNTNYYVDPEGISSLYGLAIRGDQSPTDTSNQIFFWSAGNTTTSAIGFKNNGGNFPNPTGQGDGYNTYLTMDSVGRGWVFRRGVGGSDFSSAYTSGWILNNGIWQSNGDMRAPIFYDANDTAYYTDQSGGSSHRYQVLRGAWNASPFGAEQFTIRTNYPSYCLRNTDTGSYWLVHHAADQTINWYGGAGGVDGNNWTRNLYLDMSGNLTARNNITAYSDVRLKTNIREINNPLEKVKKLRGVYFDWKETGIPSVGMIAQEVELVFPELVLTSNSSKPGEQTSKETKSLDYSKIVSVLVEAIKEQDTEVTTLRSQLQQQQSELDELKSLVKSLLANR
jgi:hypothetical protein